CPVTRAWRRRAPAAADRSASQPAASRMETRSPPGAGPTPRGAGVYASCARQLVERLEDRISYGRPRALGDRGLDRELALHSQAAAARLDGVHEPRGLDLGGGGEGDQRASL